MCERSTGIDFFNDKTDIILSEDIANSYQRNVSNTTISKIIKFFRLCSGDIVIKKRENQKGAYIYFDGNHLSVEC